MGFKNYIIIYHVSVTSNEGSFAKNEYNFILTRVFSACMRNAFAVGVPHTSGEYISVLQGGEE